MIVCASPTVEPTSRVPATVQIARSRYEVWPPEATDVSATHGQLIAIPLYDGKLVSRADANGILRYLGTVSGPVLERIHTAAGSAASRRLALFRVIGAEGDGTMLQVRLRLPALQEQCTSCRTVHFFIHVDGGPHG